jgi:hypothetical protein
VHSCEICGERCGCDMEDHEQPQPDDCIHICEEEADEYEDFEIGG